MFQALFIILQAQMAGSRKAEATPKARSTGDRETVATVSVHTILQLKAEADRDAESEAFLFCTLVPNYSNSCL